MSARTGRLDRIADRAIDAAAEALFPPNTLGAPDHREADVAARLRNYLDEVPQTYQRLITLLFVFVEWAPPWIALTPRRFSKLSLKRRQKLIRRWRGSSIYFVRMVGEAVKGLGTMIYCSHPAVLKYMGVYTVSGRDWDVAMPIEARPDALVQLARASGFPTGPSRPASLPPGPSSAAKPASLPPTPSNASTPASAPPPAGPETAS